MNIRQLPESSDIEAGNYLIVENDEGTQILDFENFVITEENTTFQPLLSTHTTDIRNNKNQIAELSAASQSLSGFWSPHLSINTAMYSFSSVSIGTTDVAQKLTLAGNVSANGSLSATGQEYNYLESRLGIGTAVPTEKLHINTTGSTKSYTKMQAAEAECGVILQNDQANWYIFLDDNSFNNSSRHSTLNFWNVHANDNIMSMTSAYKVGIGTTNPDTTLHLAGNAGITLNVRDNTDSTPTSPTANTEARIYVRQHYLVVQYNDSGTIRYKSLPLSGTNVAWEHTTSAP